MDSRLPRIALAASLLFIATACSDRSSQTTAGGEPAGNTTKAAVWTTADGNAMPYDVNGEGDVTVLLVHCWMCDRTFWHAQIPVLADHYRTIAIDLPGHGEATANRENWTVAQYGEDVAGFIKGMDLDDVVLVGHSMGGPVALRAAALADGRVIGIVAVDTLHDAEFEFSGKQVESFIVAFENDYTGTCNQFVRQMFPEEGVEDVIDHVRETGCSADRAEIGTALMKDFANIDMRQWFREAGVPIRAINSSQPNPTRIETNRTYADFDAVLMDGVGHYLHMTRPDQFNPLLIDAISGIVESRP